MKQTVQFYTTEGSRRQPQINIRGLEHPDGESHISKKTPVRVALTKSDGTAIGTLMVGDTHAIWKSHQAPAQLDLWARIKEATNEGAVVSATVEVEATAFARAEGEVVEVVSVDDLF